MREELDRGPLVPEGDLGALIGRGRTADVYRWGPDRVVKLFHAFVPPELVQHEAIIASALASAGASAPRFDGPVQVGSRPGLVFARVDGDSMLYALTRRPWHVCMLARQLADLHLMIHHAEASPDLPSQRPVLEAAIKAASDLPDAARAEALRLLRALPDEDRLCHGDFHPDNVLLSGGDPVVIDWMTATRGCPAGDVTRTMLLLQHGGLPPGTDPRTALVVRASRRLFAWGYWRRYRAGSRLRERDLAPWRVPVLAARLREPVPADERARLLQWLR